MSRSKLRNKWMRTLYAEGSWWHKYYRLKRNPHRIDGMPKNNPSRYITTHCSAYVHWLQEPTSFGGHSIPKGGHRRVSGLVRASVKREVQKEIQTELNDQNL